MDFLIPLQTKRPSVAPAGMEAAEWGLTLQRSVHPRAMLLQQDDGEKRRRACDDDGRSGLGGAGHKAQKWTHWRTTKTGNENQWELF